MGGASLEKFSGEAQLKKSPCRSKTQYLALLHPFLVLFGPFLFLSVDSTRGSHQKNFGKI